MPLMPNQYELFEAFVFVACGLLCAGLIGLAVWAIVQVLP